MQEKLTIKLSAARYIAIFLTAIRSFAALTIDGHEFLNSGWLCLVTGLILAMPFMLLCDKYGSLMRNVGNRLRIFLSAIIALYMAYESAAMSRLLINSISYSNLQKTPSIFLSAIIFAACFYAVVKNGRGIGNAHKIWLIIFVFLCAMVAITSMGDFRAKWLFPVLGPGIEVIIKGGVKAAGIIVTSQLLLCFTECDNKHEYTKCAVFGAALAIAMCIYWAIMTPLQLSYHTHRLKGIELLLANGRTSLAVLLPMTILWFMGLTAVIAGSSFTSALFLQYTFSFKNAKLYAAISVILSLLLANLGLAESDSLNILSAYAYPVFIALIIIVFIGRKRGDVL